MGKKEKTGSISGDVILDGLGGLSASGILTATFSGNELKLSGSDVGVAIDGFGETFSDFAVEKSANSLLVGLNDGGVLLRVQRGRLLVWKFIHYPVSDCQVFFGIFGIFGFFGIFSKIDLNPVRAFVNIILILIFTIVYNLQ